MKASSQSVSLQESNGRAASHRGWPPGLGSRPSFLLLTLLLVVLPFYIRQGWAQESITEDQVRAARLEQSRTHDNINDYRVIVRYEIPIL